MTTATKPKAPKTVDDFRATAGHCAALKLEAAELQAEFDTRAQELAEQYKDRIAALNAEAGTLEKLCKKWADKTPDYFEKARSVNIGTARVGYRTSPPKVKTTGRGDTFAKLALRLASLEWGKVFIRTKDPVVNKDALIDARDRLTAAQLAEAGIAIVQTESFYVDPITRELRK